MSVQNANILQQGGLHLWMRGMQIRTLFLPKVAVTMWQAVWSYLFPYSCWCVVELAFKLLMKIPSRLV